MKPLTERDYEVLCALRAHERNMAELGLSRGAHPMDVGGYNGSYHSGTLNKLVRHGLVSRSYPPRAGHRGSQRYALTEEGNRITHEHIEQWREGLAREHAETVASLGLPADTTPKQLRQVKQGILIWRGDHWEMPPGDMSGMFREGR